MHQWKNLSTLPLTNQTATITSAPFRKRFREGLFRCLGHSDCRADRLIGYQKFFPEKHPFSDGYDGKTSPNLRILNVY